MAHLKGGKLLLDLTSLGQLDLLSTGSQIISLSDEKVKAIIDKGLVLKVKLFEQNICFEPVIDSITSDIFINYNPLIDQENGLKFTFVLEIPSTQLVLNIEEI